MHFDTDVHKRSLNEEFVAMFDEVPPKVKSEPGKMEKERPEIVY